MQNSNQDIDIGAEESKSKKVFTLAICGIVQIILTAFIPITLMRDDSIGALTIFILVSINLTAFYLIYKKNRLELGTQLVILLVSCGISLFIYLEGGPFAPGMMWISAMPLTAIYMTGLKSGFFWTLGLVLVAAGINTYSFNSGFSGRLADEHAAITIIFNGVLAPLSTFFAAYFFNKHKAYVVEVMEKKNEQLDHITDGLANTLNQRNALITVVCHDIATPLSTINFASKILDSHLKKHYPEDKRLTELVEKICRARENIEQAIELTREMVAINSGKKEIEFKKVDLKQAFSKVYNLYEDKIKKKKINLKMRFEQLHFPVLAEERALVFSVIGNIFSNAIKFTPKGGEIELWISQEYQGNNPQIVMRIKDSGKGIPENNIQNIFLWHKSSSTTGTSGETGTGFGMPAVKDWMEKFGGNIRLVSRFSTSQKSDKQTKLSSPKPVKFDNISYEYEEVEKENTGAEFSLIFPKAS